MKKKLLVLATFLSLFLLLAIPLTRNLIVKAATEFWIASGSSISNTNSGKVIIGTQTSSVKLDILGTGEAGSATNTGILEIGNSLRLDQNELITNANTALYLQQGNNGDLIVDAGTLFIDSSTNRLGIGTTSPDSKLHLSGGIGSVELLVQADTDNSNESHQPKITLSQDGGVVTGNLKYESSTNNMELVNNSGNSKILLESDGDVVVRLGN